MRKIRDVLRLTLCEGLSQRQVGRSLGVPATTVAEYVMRAKTAQLSWPLPVGLNDDALETLLFPVVAKTGEARPMPDWARVHLELRRKHVTLMLLWEEYRELHPDGYGYTQFCEHYRRFAKRVDVVMRFGHRAGERMFVDFAGSTISLFDESRHHVIGEAEVFVSVLGASSLIYAEATKSQELIYWIAAHDHAFAYYGGVPELVVSDNLASGVTKANRYEPRVNATYLEMAEHYGCAILPTRPRRPRDKAKVETSVLVVSRWILAALRDERFTSIAEANVAIARLIERVNNRPFKVLDGSRRSVFEQLERHALRPLPAQPYDFATWKRAKVGLGYHVEAAERHYYSVPYRLAGEVVDVRLGSSSVEFFHRGQRVAAHPRSFQRFGYTTDPSHMPDAHRRYLEWTPERIVNWATKTGPATAELVQKVMAERPHPEQGFRSCIGIIRLGQSYGGDRLEAACARALAIHSHTYTSVSSILKRGLDQKTLTTQVPVRSHPHHEFVRGANYYQ